MDLISRIEALLNPAIAELGFDLVRVRLSGQRRLALQVMIERQDGVPISVDDCAEVSHLVSAIMDVEDLIQNAWTLEVSSAGIDRPLVKAKDFIAAIGFQAKVQLSMMQDGRKRFRGTIEAANETEATLRDDDGEAWTFALALVQDAKLVLDDKLIAASRAKAEAMGWRPDQEGGLIDEGDMVDGLDEELGDDQADLAMVKPKKPTKAKNKAIG